MNVSRLSRLACMFCVVVISATVGCNVGLPLPGQGGGGTDAAAGDGGSGVADGGSGEDGSVDKPDCTGKECGDDGLGGICGVCINDCTGEPDPSFCSGWTCMHACCPYCGDRECGDDGCGSLCGMCQNDQVCLPNGLCGDCAPDCSNKQCGDNGCGGSCGECIGCTGEPDPSFCVDGFCERACCMGDCTGKACGDMDSNNCGKCIGACPGDCGDGPPDCDEQTYTCVCNPCQGKNCGEQSGSYICMGPCPNAGEECKADSADPAKVKCVGCSTAGLPVGEVCGVQSDCKCGNDCVKLFDGASQPQKTGQCLEDCFSDGKCADPAQVCACSKMDAPGQNCIMGDCFATGTLRGSFSGAVLSKCGDQQDPGDIGSGNIAITLPGKSGSVDMFLGCRYTTTTDDYVMVQGMKQCGNGPCLDAVLFGVKANAIAREKIAFNSGTLFADVDSFVLDAGSTVTEWYIRAVGIDGSITFTQAGTTGKQPIAGSVDVKLIKYDHQTCGGASGVDCADWTPHPYWP